MMPVINMRSTATSVQGQGVGSCYIEQVNLVRNGLPKDFSVVENSKKPCHILHYHTINPTYYIEAKLKSKKIVRVGYVHFLPVTLENSINLPKFCKSIFYKYVLSFYNNMDYLVVVNPMFIKQIRECGISKPKILCIPNFVAKKSFYAKTDNEKKLIKKSLGFIPDDFIVMGAGQLQKRKGIFDFIKTAELLPDVRFIWAGGFSFGKISDGYAEIKPLVENPPKNVTFLGMVDRSKMNDLYNAADIMFLPSFDELFPMTILEALSTGTPCLLRDIDEYKDILYDSYMTGTSPETFAEAITRVRDDSDKMSFWVDKTNECSKIYSEDGILRQWTKFYTKILGK